MKKKLRMILAVLFISAFSFATISEAQTVKNEDLKKSDSVKIRLRVKDKTITATLIDSNTARDFISLLPLTLTMKDLFHREKFAHLPRAISTEGERAHKYGVGEIAYWSPGPDVAIYYRQDGFLRKYPIFLPNLLRPFPLKLPWRRIFLCRFPA